MDENFADALEEVRTEKTFCTATNMEVPSFRCFHVEGEIEYDSAESKELLGQSYEPLMRAHCVRQGLLAHAPGSKAEVLDEGVEQLKMECEAMRASRAKREASGGRGGTSWQPWVLLYYLKVIHFLDGVTNPAAVEAVEAALGEVKKAAFPNGPPKDTSRFVAQYGTTRESNRANGVYVLESDCRVVAQFEPLAEKMIQAHYSPSGVGRKRDRKRFEADNNEE